MAAAHKWNSLFKKDSQNAETEIKAQVKNDLENLKRQIEKDPKMAEKAAQIIEEMMKEKPKKK